MKLKLKYALIASLLLLTIFCFLGAKLVLAEMPFYNLRPKDLVLRAEFYTSYSSSTDERKNNIYVASKSLNNTLVDVGGEFSFNRTVGARTEKRGYKSAKIIYNGEFIEGVGGGVCQVSTTLYNAVLLAGLKVTEYHPHSLKVSYVAPSFDAMVNSNTADLKFVNDTNNPIYVKSSANGEKLKIQIYGEEMGYTINRESVNVSTIPAPLEEVFEDDKGEYPDLFEGEKRVIAYSKNGLISEGYLLINKKGNVERIKIRKDKYNPYRGSVVIGKRKRENIENIINENSLVEE